MATKQEMQNQIDRLRLSLRDCQREYEAEKKLRQKAEMELRVRGRIYDDILSAMDGLKKLYFICSQAEKKIDDNLHRSD